MGWGCHVKKLSHQKKKKKRKTSIHSLPVIQLGVIDGMETTQAVIGQEGEYTQDRPLTCWRVNTKTVNPPTLALTQIVNSESPINLNPCISLHCGRKLEYLQKNPENPHRQREHPTPHRKAARLDSTQNLFHQTLNRNRQIISKSS